MTNKFNSKNFDGVDKNEYGIIARKTIDDEYSKFSFFNTKGDFLFEMTAKDNSGVFPFEFKKIMSLI